MKIPLSKPDIGEREINAVVDVLKSGVLSLGPRQEEFEKKLSTYVGVKHGIAVSSGTSGLHLVIRAYGIGPGDEVITTPFSFISSTSCLLYEGARPVFVDIDRDTLNIDCDLVEQAITDKTKAILAVDVFGHPVDMVRLKEIAEKYRLVLIEDACEAMGSEFKGIKCGSIADASVFAFYPNKQITTGEGGMVVTNDDRIAELIRSMRNQGRAPEGKWLSHERLGYNYRMNEMSAALGCIQLDRLEEFIDKRNAVAAEYDKRLNNIEGVTVPYVGPHVTRMSRFVYVIRLDERINRDKVMQHLIDNGIDCRPYFTPIHLQPFIKDKYGFKGEEFPETERAGRTCLALPFYNNLSVEDIEYVVDGLKKGIEWVYTNISTNISRHSS